MKGSRPGRVRFGNAILCEYIRPEVNNKYSLLGVMAGDILVPEFPANIAIAFYIELIFSSLGKHAATLSIKYDNNTIGELHAEMEISGLSSPTPLALPFVVVPVGRPGQLKISVHIDGQDYPKIIERSVSAGSVQTSLPSPTT